MLKPDSYFKDHQNYFPAKDRREARKLFRRAIREYYVMQRQYVIEPESGKRVQSVMTGEVIRQQKNQNRRVKLLFKGRSSAGQPKRPEIKFLIARLFILWGKYAKGPATLSWKHHLAYETDFEAFLLDLLPKLGASDVRRYVEAHWKGRK
jgi:hypothetical protein